MLVFQKKLLIDNFNTMTDFHKILGFDDVYDKSLTFTLPLFKKLGIKQNHTIAAESWYYVDLLNKNGIKSSWSDIFSWIVNLAKSRYPNIDFKVDDMRDFVLDKKVELITCMDWCINHVFSLKEVEETFQSVYNNLEDKWYFYFEFWTLEEVWNSKDYANEKNFVLEWYDIMQKERRFWNNIHNMLTVIKKDWEIIDILNAYHTSFDYDEVINLLKKSGFKKHIEVPSSNNITKNILAFKY